MNIKQQLEQVIGNFRDIAADLASIGRTAFSNAVSRETANLSAIVEQMEGREPVDYKCPLCNGVGRIGSPGQICEWCKGTGRSQSAAPQVPDGMVLWLWKNFVDGKPEYWAFDNPFPVHLDGGDPQTLGEPCGYALFKESLAGRHDVTEAEVLRRIAIAAAKEEGSAS